MKEFTKEQKARMLEMVKLERLNTIQDTIQEMTEEKHRMNLVEIMVLFGILILAGWLGVLAISVMARIFDK